MLDGVHRFEHWYRDNTVYFITAKCREGFHVFASEDAKRVFWDRFNHYTALFGFVPWVTTVLSNLDRAIARAVELHAFLLDVSYPRYSPKRKRR